MLEQVLEGGPGLGILAADPQVTAALVEALAAPEATVRRMAVSMLARSGTPQAAGALVMAVGFAATVPLRVRAAEPAYARSS